MLSGEQWAVLEPLVEVCRPKGKAPPQDLRRTLGAILWRHQNGAKWRAVPADLALVSEVSGEAKQTAPSPSRLLRGSGSSHLTFVASLTMRCWHASAPATDQKG